MKLTLIAVPAAVLLAVAAPALSEEATPSADDVARELANPNNSLASLAFRNQYRTYTGDLPNAGDQGNYTLLFQPVFPFSLQDTASGGKANLFIRPAIPILVSQPVFDATEADFHGKTALGDIGFDVAYGVTEKSGFIWAYGMVGSLPTASSKQVASKQLRLGPTFMLAKGYKWGLIGMLPNHMWNVTNSSKGKFSTTSSQFFATYLPGGGWNVATMPILAYDWKSEEATIPLNVAVGKTMVMGKTPVKMQLEVNYYVEQPDLFGPEWMIGFNITPVVPNVVAGWFGK